MSTVLSNVSMDTLGSIFTQALIEVISKISGFSLEVSSAEQDPHFDEIVAFMSLCGPKGGMVFISSAQAGMRTLCSYMEGVPESEVTEDDVEDVLCELVNMTAGNAKMQLNGTEYMYTLSSPLIMTGKDLSIYAKKRINIVSRTVGNGDISVKLKIVF